MCAHVGKVDFDRQHRPIGYTVYRNGEPVYTAGNNRFESTSYVDPDSASALDLATLQQYAAQTAREMDAEREMDELSDGRDLPRRALLDLNTAALMVYVTIEVWATGPAGRRLLGTLTGPRAKIAKWAAQDHTCNLAAGEKLELVRVYR
jgi:hypothetical protein